MNKFKHYYYNKILKEADSKEGTVDGIDLRRSYIKELPDFIKDLTVTTRFDVGANLLTSCKNFPKYVGTVLNANYNNITSLEGLQHMGESLLALAGNPIVSLEYLEKFAGKDVEGIQFNNCKLESCKGIENITMTDAYLSNNSISSWEFIPKSMKELTIDNNKLTSWKGMPSGLSTLRCYSNWDVTNFNDYKTVEFNLEISSSIWNSYLEAFQVMREHSITRPIIMRIVDMD